MKIRAILLRAVIVLLLMAAAGFVAVKSRAARHTSGSPPETTPAPVGAAVSGKLTFVSRVVEARVAEDATYAQLDFSFENRTDRTLVISRVEKNCDCMQMLISGGKLAYAPGEGGVIRARYELGNMAGTVDKDFKLYQEGDTDDNPSHVLVARLIIPELVAISAKTLAWQTGKPAAPQKVDLSISGGNPIRILGTSCVGNDARVELKTVEDGRRYELWVTPVDTNSPGLSTIRLDTDCAIPRWKALQIFASVQEKPVAKP